MRSPHGWFLRLVVVCCGGCRGVSVVVECSVVRLVGSGGLSLHILSVAWLCVRPGRIR